MCTVNKQCKQLTLPDLALICGYYVLVYIVTNSNIGMYAQSNKLIAHN